MIIVYNLIRRNTSRTPRTAWEMSIIVPTFCILSLERDEIRFAILNCSSTIHYDHDISHHYFVRRNYQGWIGDEYSRTTFPVSPSRLPSTTPRITSPPTLGSCAPSLFNSSVSPPREVADNPGAIAQTFTPSFLNRLYHCTINMLRPAFADRYPTNGRALGSPAGAEVFLGSSGSEAPCREERPLVINNNLGSWDLSSSGRNLVVMICAPVTFTSQDLFHACRAVMPWSI